MLEIQVAVFEGTKSLNKTIQANADKKPRPEDRLLSLSLAKKQQAIINEANIAIDMLKGAAVAFTEVFDQVHVDMKHAHGRLLRCDVGITTQAMQRDIMDTLKEMITPIRCPKKTSARP